MVESRKPITRWLVPSLVIIAAVGLGWYFGARIENQTAKPDTESPENADGVYRDVAGRVVRLAPEQGMFTVDHEEIEGFMAAMVMDLHVADPAELKGLKPDDKILFDLIRIGETYQVVHIRRLSDEADETSSSSVENSPVNPLQRGDLVPDLTLVDSEGSRFRLHEMKPRHKLITFFYVRCPLNDFCPAQSRRLAQLQQHIKDRDLDLHLLSLTLDGEHDKTGVLADYANHFNADPDRWTFACSEPPEAIRQFAHRAGTQIRRRAQTFQIDHALVALRVDGNRIVDRVYGLDAIEQLVRTMK